MWSLFGRGKRKSGTRQPSDRWTEFRGLSNTDDVLRAKAAALTTPYCAIAFDISRRTARALKKSINDAEFHVIFMEMCFLYLHVTDRIAQAVLGDKERWLFMDSLYFGMQDELCRNCPVTDENAFRRMFDDTFAERQAEYGTYRFQANAAMEAGSLPWEVAQRISESLGHPHDLRFAMHGTVLYNAMLTTVLSDLDLCALLVGPGTPGKV